MWCSFAELKRVHVVELLPSLIIFFSVSTMRVQCQHNFIITKCRLLAQDEYSQGWRLWPRRRGWSSTENQAVSSWPWLVSCLCPFQTTGRACALRKSCRQCVKWPPAAAIWSQSQNAAVMVDEAGATSVSCARFLEPPSTKRFVLMARDTPLMGEVAWWGTWGTGSDRWILYTHISLKEVCKNDPHNETYWCGRIQKIGWIPAYTQEANISFNKAKVVRRLPAAMTFGIGEVCAMFFRTSFTFSLVLCFPLLIWQVRAIKSPIDLV